MAGTRFINPVQSVDAGRTRYRLHRLGRPIDTGLTNETSSPEIDDEMNGVGLEAETSPYVRAVPRIRRQVMSLNRDFQVSRDGMFIRFAQIQGRLGATLGSSLTEGEINRRANSIFLPECM
jgi:hypothetical protein